jgi:hypothetical protein
MAKLRSALLTGPKTIEELMDLGISRATTYRDLGVLSKSGEVVQQPVVEKGSVRFTYILTSATPPADDERVLVAMKGVKSENPKVKQHAYRDLTELSKKARIGKSLRELMVLGESNPTIVLEILANQAIHAQKDQDASTIEVLRNFMPTAIAIVMDRAKPMEDREQALRFLQLTADFDTLSDLAIKVTRTTGDPALTSLNPTQFGINIQSICVNAARFPKYRSKFYDLLLSNQSEITNRVEQILNLSREPPFI